MSELQVTQCPFCKTHFRLTHEQLHAAAGHVRCGACLNVCPVYRHAGGHSYGWVYSGPIGAVITPSFVGHRAAAELPFASSLCGACREVCPARIMPHLIHRCLYRDDLEEAERARVDLCVKCGLCAYVCPSKIELRSEMMTVQSRIAEELHVEETPA